MGAARFCTAHAAGRHMGRPVLTGSLLCLRMGVVFGWGDGEGIGSKGKFDIAATAWQL